MRGSLVIDPQSPQKYCQPIPYKKVETSDIFFIGLPVAREVTLLSPLLCVSKNVLLSNSVRECNSLCQLPKLSLAKWDLLINYTTLTELY